SIPSSRSLASSFPSFLVPKLCLGTPRATLCFVRDFMPRRILCRYSCCTRRFYEAELRPRPFPSRAWERGLGTRLESGSSRSSRFLGLLSLDHREPREALPWVRPATLDH